jgi:hypothetical protein
MPMTLSEHLRALPEADLSAPVSLGTLLQRTGEMGVGIISGLLVLPMLIPLPVLLGAGINSTGQRRNYAPSAMP